MENKNKIGALVMLGGIALLGYYYFKKNKPTTASTQLVGLENLSNYYKSGGTQEDTKINVDYTVQPINNKFQDSLGSSPFLDPAFAKQLQDANREAKENMAIYGTPNNPNKPIDTSNYIIPELANFGKITLNQEAINSIANMNTGLAGINFSNLKV
jgi:hypothetical protein